MEKRRIDYRHFIMIAFILGSLALIPFFFQYAHLRIAESAVDLFNSGKFYISELFDLDLYGEITVNNFTEQPFELPFNLPQTWEEFVLNMDGYWTLFFSMENFSAYMVTVGNVFVYITKAFMIAMPVFLIFFVVSMFAGQKHNNDYGKETKALRAFKKLEIKVYKPVKDWFVSFVDFVKTNTDYLKILALIWAYSFNFIAVVISAVAYYLFFIVALKTPTLYIQLVKLLKDASVMINFVPVWLWVIVGFIIFDRIRKKLANARLNYYEMRNRQYIKALPIIAMNCGTMGTGKTTMLTDMVLSQAVMFREDALKKLIETDLKFPDFPWINFENELKWAMSTGEVNNLASCRKYIVKMRRRFERILKTCEKRGIIPDSTRHQSLLFGYDWNSKSLAYDDKLKVSGLWKVLEDYAQFYYFYVLDSSLILSNYSIRTDNIKIDKGNFPLWDNDFFQRDSRLIDGSSRYAHIFDFDMFRLGKRMLKDNKRADAFEFGVVAITEAGKERGNQKTQAYIGTKDVNPVNDGYDKGQKIIRHAGTIDNSCFVKIFMDEQRSDSINANERELCYLVHIREKSEMRLAMPFFFFEELAYNFLFSRFKDFYLNFRHNRGDNTLISYLLKKLAAKLHSYYVRTYNLYGYYVLETEKERGTQDGNIEKQNYYIMPKKIYSRRFATDAYSDILAKKALRSPVGLPDIPTFATERATLKEMDQEHSYFVNDILKVFSDNDSDT